MSGEQDGKPDESAEPTKPKQQSERRESGLTAIQESRLHKRQVKENWLGGKRWPTDTTVEEIESAEKERPLTLREKAALSVGKDLSDKDRRVRRIAVKAVLAMEKQNQDDDLHPEEHGGSGDGPIQLVRVVVGNREEAGQFESIKMSQLGEMVQNEPEPIEDEDAD